MNKQKFISSQIILFYCWLNQIVQKIFIYYVKITPSSTHILTPGKFSQDGSPKHVYIFHMIGFHIFEAKSHFLSKSILQKRCHFRPHLMILCRTFSITFLFFCPAIICKILHQKCNVIL